MRRTKYNLVPINPMTGVLDNRSLPEQVPTGGWRFRQNFSVTDENKLCRMEGWEKFLSNPDYNNEDLHDQLLYLCGLSSATTSSATSSSSTTTTSTPSTTSTETTSSTTSSTTTPLPTTGTHIRQPIRYMREIISTTNSRRLLVGTQNRIYKLNESLGNYDIIADRYGGEPVSDCSSFRWYSATVGDYTLFTNDADPILYWTFDDSATDCVDQGAQPVPEMATIGLTRAAVIYQWRGVVWLGDVEMDNERASNRVVWSDVDAPLSWVPDAGVSAAGLHDLDSGERVLKMMEMGEYLLIYTTHGIWQVTVVPDASLFNFRKVYSEPLAGDKCLRYRNTLVSTGGTHVYWGEDGIYYFNLFYPEPQRTEWVHRATKDIFDNINSEICDVHVGELRANGKEIWCSWATEGETCPNKTFVINIQNPATHFVDHGFTAFSNYRSDDRLSIREFLINNCVCTGPQYDVFAPPPPKEGGICNPITTSTTTLTTPTSTTTTTTCPLLDSIYTTVPITVGENETEDFNQPEPSPNSLCVFLAGVTFEDLCNQCERMQVFAMASSDDFSIKQFGGVYFRERVVDWSPCAVYAEDGYDSIIRTSSIHYGEPEDLKEIGWMSVKYIAESQTVPSDLQFRVGYSEQPNDPNLTGTFCEIIWRDQIERPLKCWTDKGPETHRAEKTKPSRDLEWALYYEGQNLYYEFTISGTGGASCFSALNPKIKILPSCH